MGMARCIDRSGATYLVNLQWVQQNFTNLSGVVSLGPPGGQKQVFAATHSTDGDVVLKIVHPNIPTTTIDREVMAVEQVQSPRVPRILEIGIMPSPFGDCIWIREQRVNGITLRERLQSGPLGPTEILKLAYQMLEALTDAERAQIVHRDVKPDNTMIDVNGDFWLLDFGIARHLTMSALTATAAPFGKFTPGYAPVEQFRNVQAEIDSRADLFALGVMVYECATEVQPFWNGANGPLDILKRVETVQLLPLVVPCADSDSFRDLIDVMTKKRRDQRVSSVHEALDWMREIMTAEGLAT